MMGKKKFYDWDKTLSHTEARTFAVFGAKNIGKTFGLRVKSIEKYLKTGLRMCEIDRTKSALPALSHGYFDKIQKEGFFVDHEFDTSTEEMRVKRPNCKEWETIGYFVALTDLQNIKKRNCLARGNLIFDEAVIEESNRRYHNYLPKEIDTLAKVVDTITRENELDPSTQTARLFLLGNSCDLHTPYLEWLGIKNVPEKYGYTWCRNKTALFHYPEPTNYHEKMKNTLAGQMLSGSDEAEMAFANKFASKKEMRFVEKKTQQAKLYCGIEFHKQTFALWIDSKNGKMFVTRNMPTGTGKPTFFFVDSDGNIDYKSIAKSHTICEIIKGLYNENLIRYDTLQTKGMFAGILNLLGIRMN